MSNNLNNLQNLILENITLLERKGKKKFITVDHQNPNKLNPFEITYPFQKGRFNGVSVGKDYDGFFVATHRARSKSYKDIRRIPEYIIKKIESTG